MRNRSLGNPHGLAIDLHVLPVASIKRFCGADGYVHLHDLIRGRVRRAGPRDSMFCARRAWDHGSETGFMKRIEDAFQDLVGKIIGGAVTTIAGSDKRIVDQFFALWYVRSRHRTLAIQEIQVKKISGDDLSRDQEELLEKRGILFTRTGGCFLARQLNGKQIQIFASYIARTDLAASRWGVIEAQAGEFIVPDMPWQLVIPITPTRGLASPAPSGMITRQNLTEINRNAIAGSQAYFFARDFGACPVWRARPTQPG